MSVRTLAAVADLSDIPPTCKLVLYGLAVDAGRFGQVSTSYVQLERNTGLSERAIRDNLRILERNGVINRDADSSSLTYQIPAGQ